MDCSCVSNPHTSCEAEYEDVLSGNSAR